MTAPRRPETTHEAARGSTSVADVDQAPAAAETDAAPLCRYEELAERENRLRAHKRRPE